MRWALAGLLAAGGLITALAFGWSGLGWGGPPPAPTSAAGESAWQLRELAFLKTVYDRMRKDGERETAGGASLRQEQERIVGQMAEVAKLLPATAVPAELRALLADAAAPASPSRPAATIAAETPIPEPLPGRGVPDLRVGLRAGPGGAPRPVAAAADFPVDPALREPLRPAPAAVREPRRKPRETDRSR